MLLLLYVLATLWINDKKNSSMLRLKLNSIILVASWCILAAALRVSCNISLSFILGQMAQYYLLVLLKNCITFRREFKIYEKFIPTITMISSSFADEFLKLRQLDGFAALKFFSRSSNSLLIGYYSVRIFIWCLLTYLNLCIFCEASWSSIYVFHNRMNFWV